MKCVGHFQIAKCPTGNQNVWQSTECLRDILCGTPEIILAITAVDTATFLNSNFFLVFYFHTCRMCVLELNQLTKDVVRVLKVLYGSLHK